MSCNHLIVVLIWISVILWKDPSTGNLLEKATCKSMTWLVQALGVFCTVMEDMWLTLTFISGRLRTSGKTLMWLECEMRVWSLLQLDTVEGTVFSLFPLTFSSSSSSSLLSLLTTSTPWEKNTHEDRRGCRQVICLCYRVETVTRLTLFIKHGCDDWHRVFNHFLMILTIKIIFKESVKSVTLL